MVGREHGKGAVGQHPVEVVAGGLPALAQDRVIGLHGKDDAVVGALARPRCAPCLGSASSPVTP